MSWVKLNKRRVGNVFWLPTNMILMLNGMPMHTKTRLPTLPDYPLT